MQLAKVILFQLAETPMTYELISRWVRIQWPRVLPDAIGAALCELRTAGFVECAAQQWRVVLSYRKPRR